MAELFVQDSVQIDAPADRIWDVLTKPGFTRQYMFGCETVSDWKVGSPLLWKGTFGGKEIVAVKGSIVKIEPGRFLEYTTFDPNSGREDTPANYLTVTYRLTPQNGAVLLDVTQGDFARVADSEKKYQETVVGWSSLLRQIKALAEKR